MRFSEHLSFRWNTWDGEIVAMAGNSEAHGLIVASTTNLVTSALIGKPFKTSAGVSVKAPVSYLVPDLIVYCSGGEFTKEGQLLNPLVIFEVLSNSTELYDRGQSG